MARIAENPGNVVVPVIETIKDDDFSINMSLSKNIQVGGFSWNLNVSLTCSSSHIGTVFFLCHFTALGVSSDYIWRN